MTTRFEQIRNKVTLVRDIELSVVLAQNGAMIDIRDPAKWHTEQGILSIKGQKFFNWTKNIGGGGAIDMIIHLHNVDFIKAVCWLTDNFHSPDVRTLRKTKPLASEPLILPNRNQKGLSQITRYLTLERCLPETLVRSLISTGNLYADDRANAVFLLLGKGKTVVGAEIRGTTDRPWHALASGSRKDRGCFYVKNGQSRNVVICESAIDAISYHSLDRACIALSTAGAHPNPLWLSSLIKRGFNVFCGFDADETGDTLAKKMITLHPSIKRLRPPRHDWNDVLKFDQGGAIFLC